MREGQKVLITVFSALVLLVAVTLAGCGGDEMDLFLEKHDITLLTFA